jgi:8-oxo-dGTP diphosphatase
MEINRFNIRVYGLLTDDGKILVSDEFRLGIFMTKFPGGGLKFGEGTIDCLKREFREELDSEIEKISHYYTTDFFQQTTLLPTPMQVINIYYRVCLSKPYQFRVTEKKFDFPEIIDGTQCFRWLRLDEISENDFTLPIDKRIVKMIQSSFQ